MIGFCKCDICGSMYHKDKNKNYDGLMVWYAHKEDGTIMHGSRNYDIIRPNGENVKGVPEMMDVCPRCFDRFCDWVKKIKEENK